MTPLPGNYVGSGEFWVLIAIGVGGLALAAVPTLLTAVRVVYMIGRRSKEQREARDLIRQEAWHLFGSLKEEQIAAANRQLETGISAFNLGHWTAAHDLFVSSIVLAVTSSDQALGAALTAYNLNDYRKAIEYSTMVKEERADATKELKARCYLQIDDLKREEIDFLTQVCSGLKQRLKHDVAHIVVRWWLKVPSLEDQIEALLLLVSRERPGVIEYREALARYRLLQGRNDDALVICASIPEGDHTEGSLAVYSEILRGRGDRSPQAFACIHSFWTTRPDHVENSVYLAMMCLERKDVGLAEAIIRRGLGLTPDEARLRYHLALILRFGGRTQECLSELQELLRIPESGTYRSHDDVRLLMAKCLMESNVYDAAVRQLQGMTRTRAVLDLLYDLGTKYSAVGKHEKARECWEDIYAVDVRYSDVATRIQTQVPTANT